MTRSVRLGVVFSLCVTGVFAQQDTRGTIFGRITDPSGGVLLGATVRAINSQTGVALESRSNEAGNYSIPFVVPGTYDISAQLPGFKSLERKGIEVHVADRVQLDLEMAVGDVSEKVEVVANAPMLETSTVSLGQVVDTKRIMELPIQSGNAAEFVLLSPGTVNATDLRMRKAAFNNAPSQVVTDGNAQYSNEFAIDGVPNTFAAGSNARIAFSPPQAAVAEFRVQTTTYDAALGHTPGAVVNTLTTGGTNAFHGEAHWFVANSALDAAAFFANRSGTKKTVYQDNRYGASVGGPVVLPGYNGRNKTFFFYAYEGDKWGTPTTVIATVPTAAEKTGDFSSLLRLGTAYQLYDPFSTTPTGNGHYSRQPISGNIISSSRLNPVSAAMAKYWPDPNQAGTSDGRSNFA
ncbi:MAG TPA: carboxypeptidase-like regulatory domain-containing protein, partial [Candidatus Nitrosotalea sp.]|nr:carboxypeptidase-like regulatory domain-containing protein [Candidatus Nitrosotalea sp.]